MFKTSDMNTILPRTDILRTENYTVKSKEELLNILKDYVEYCDKKKYRIGTTLSVLRYFEHMRDNIDSYFNRRKKRLYKDADIKKRIEFIGRSLFWKKTHSNLKDVIFKKHDYQAKRFDLENVKNNLYVDQTKLRKLLIEDTCKPHQI